MTTRTPPRHLARTRTHSSPLPLFNQPLGLLGKRMWLRMEMWERRREPDAER